jgi:mitochondrial chaperone BCS1
MIRTVLRLTRKYCTVSLEIPSKDRSYQWMLQWLSKQDQTSSSSSSPLSSSRLVSLFHSLSRQQHLGVETTFSQSPSGVISTHFDFVPSPGEHTFWYRNRIIHYTRTRDKSMVDIQTGSPWETVTLRCFGRNRQLMLQLLTDAKTAALRRQENKTIIFTSSGVDWRPFGQPRRKRPLESVVLDKGVAEGIQRDFADFLTNQLWYVERGIPYRRGYLLYDTYHTHAHARAA